MALGLEKTLQMSFSIQSAISEMLGSE